MPDGRESYLYSREDDDNKYLEPSRVLDAANDKEFPIQKRLGYDFGFFSFDEIISGELPDKFETEAHEQELLIDLKHYLKMTRGQRGLYDIEEPATRNILKAISNFFATDYQLHQNEEVKSDSFKANLRRSALLIYKSARIPGTVIKKGGYKLVEGPIGVGAEKLPKYIPDNALTWDGNYETIETGAQRAVNEQYVHLKSRYGRQDSSKRIRGELGMLTKVSAAIPNSPNLPQLRGKTPIESSRYLEHLQRYQFKDYDQLADDLQNVMSVIYNAADLAGVVHLDIKPSNIMRRPQDNAVVVIDWGSALDLNESGWTRKYASTFGFEPPELDMDLKSVSRDNGPDIEKIAVYGTSALAFACIFGERDVKRWLDTVGVGYEWTGESVILQGTGSKYMSLTNESYLDYWKARDDVKIPRNLADAICNGLAADPTKRIGMDDFRLLLQDLGEPISYKEYMSAGTELEDK